MSPGMRVMRNRQPRPFLKWAGGKSALLSEILGTLPDAPSVYVEPFLGGGAVLLEMLRRGRVTRAVAADRNPALIETWRQVRDDVEGVIHAMARWKSDKPSYYRIRARDTRRMKPAQRAARVIYLNRHGFNGLYRVNQSGQFNVPFGAHSSRPRVDLDNLRAVSEALRAAEVELLEASDFEPVMARAGAGDAVYCDPPYWPMSQTANFTAYDGFPFVADDQQRLARAFSALAERGAFGLLSNHDVEPVRGLYEGFEQRQVLVRRNINRNGRGRGPVPELLISTRRSAAEATG